MVYSWVPMTAMTVELSWFIASGPAQRQPTCTVTLARNCTRVRYAHSRPQTRGVTCTTQAVQKHGVPRAVPVWPGRLVALDHHVWPRVAASDLRGDTSRVVHRAQTWHRPHCDTCRRKRCGNTAFQGSDGADSGSRWFTARGPVRRHPTYAATAAGNYGCAPCTHMEQTPWRPVHPTQAVRKHDVPRAVWPGAGLGSRWITARGPVRRHPTYAVTPACNDGCAPCTHMAQTPWQPVYPTQAVRKHGVTRACGRGRALGRAGSPRVAPCGSI